MREIFKVMALGFITSWIAGCFGPEIEPIDREAFKTLEVATSDSKSSLGEDDWSALRVGGDLEAAVEITEGKTDGGEKSAFYRAGKATISAALPTDYPAPTAPGAIELKRYDSYRHAIIEGEDGERGLFFPLFNHIKDRQISMTAPVVMTGEMAGDDSRQSTMAFLYRRPSLGKTGEAEKGIRVEDTVTTTVLSVAFLGEKNRDSLEQYREKLDAWIESQEGETRWEVAGDARLLGYNGPDKTRKYRWFEYQLPVKRSGVSSNQP